MKKRFMTGLYLALLGFSLLAGLWMRQGFAAARAGSAPDPQAVEEVRLGKRAVANAAWWGFDPDDATRFLQAAIDSGAPKVVVPYMGSPWIVTPIKLRSCLELVFEPGVLVLAKKGEFKGKSDSMFEASDAVDITLRGYGATLRMRKEDYQSEAYKKAEWRMVLDFHGCRRVRVEGLRLESSGGDGIYLGTGTLGYCADVVIRDVVCHDNHRQGISVISAVNLLVENCVLSDTGGTAPQAGIDFEPNGPNDKLVNCLMRHCVVEGNAGPGILIYPKPLSKQSDPVSIRVENCLLRGGKGAGIEIGAVLDDGPDGMIEFENCTIERTALAGIAIHDKSADRARVRFIDCRCKDVGLKMDGAGFDKNERAVPVRVTSRRPKLVKKHGGIDFVDCRVYDTVDRPVLVLEDKGSGSGIHDLQGNITVRSPYPARMDVQCKSFNVGLKIVKEQAWRASAGQVENRNSIIGGGQSGTVTDTRPSPAGATEPLALEAGQLYLVFDPRLHGTGEQCELKVHSFKRHPANPVVKPEYPWEGLHHGPKLKPSIQLLGFIQVSGTVLWEPQEGIFRMWYAGSTDVEFYTCYAVSKDGVHWEKPMLGLHEVLGTRQNNVSSYGDSGVAIYRDARANDPARRYVKWSMQSRDGDDGVPTDYSIYRHFSPDGLRWVRESRKPAIPGHPSRYLGGLASDVTVTYWFERLSKHVCFLKCQTPNPNPAPEDTHGHALRQFIRFESADGKHWSQPTWAFVRDAEDLKLDPYFQFYGVSVHPVGDLYIAFPWVYHSQEGTFDIGLAYSTDTVKWERPFRGQYVLPCGARGEWDGGCIVTAYHLVEKDGMWWLYYGGTPYDHHKLDTKRYMAIGLARMPIGRVVSACCFGTKGSWTVGPVKLTGRELIVNAAIFDNLRVTILNEQGKPIPGYTSQVVRGNHIELPVRWDDGKDWASLAGRIVKLRFDMYDAEVFGFKCR